MHPLLLLLFTTLVSLAGGTKADFDEMLHGTHISPPALPTEVELGVYLIGLTNVSPANNPYPTFTAEMMVDMVWTDPRLAFDPAEVGVEVEHFQGHLAEALLERIWWPELVVENEQGTRQIEHIELELRHDGQLELKERFSVTAHAEVDLRKFPFDHQDFELRFASFSWDDKRLQLKVDRGHSGFDPDFHNLEWEITGVSTAVASAKRIRLPEPVSVFTMKIHADRYAGFYLYKLLVPLVAIVIFTWSAFWMTNEPWPSRMQRTFVALLTVVAFHHITAGHLPRISYLTFVDAVVYAAFLSVGVSLLLIVIIHNLEQYAMKAAARWVEILARILLPFGFVGLLGLLWIVYHL